MADRTTVRAAGGPMASFLPVAASGSGSFGTLLGLSMRRPGGRRAVSLLTLVLLVSGVAMFSFPAVTDIFQRYQQTHVKLNSADPHYQTLYREHRIKIGQGLTRLVINNDRMHVNVVVVQGTTPA